VKLICSQKIVQRLKDCAIMVAKLGFSKVSLAGAGGEPIEVMNDLMKL